MVKAWNIIIAIVLYCAILDYAEGADEKNIIDKIPAKYYPNMKAMCIPIEMDKFIECFKKKAKKMTVCDNMPDPCNKEAYLAYLKKFAAENPALLEELIKCSKEIGAFLACIPKAEKCKK